MFRTKILAVLAAAAAFPSATAYGADCPDSQFQNWAGTTVPCPCFAAGEKAGAIFDPPAEDYPIQILSVGIVWQSASGGSPPSLEQAVHIYNSGLPDPGIPIFSLDNPVLQDQPGANEFDLEADNIVLNSGPFTVALEFANANANMPAAPSVVFDVGCQPGKNVIFAIPGGWTDACDLDVPGNWAFEVVYRRMLPDCNANGIADDCDIDAGASSDCDRNGIPDECDISAGAADCNGNGVPDACEVVDVLFSDGFDTYAAGSQMHGQGGWKGWNNDPAFGALVTAAQHSSPPHAVDIMGPSDLVHEFAGAVSGRWTLTAWQFLPSTTIDCQLFIVLNTYGDELPDVEKNWSTQVEFDGNIDVGVIQPDNIAFLLQPDTWVPLRLEVDLDADTQTFFYDNQEVYTWSWTNGTTGGGALNIAAVDLFANGAGSVYYDDISLVQSVNDCNGNGVPDACDIADALDDDCNVDGIPDTCPGSVSRTNIPAGIAPPDGTGEPVCHTFTVDEYGTIQDVDIGVEVTHTYLQDLIITVEHNGQAVDLWLQQCGGQDNMDVIFDDEGGDETTSCADIPTHVRVQPVELLAALGPGLAAFDGMDKHGDWTICISDNLPVDTGTLDAWSLYFTETGDTPPSAFTDTSPQFSFNGSGTYDFSHSITSPPAAASNVVIKLTGQNANGGPCLVSVNNNEAGTVAFFFCDAETQSVTISANTFNAWIDGGDATIGVSLLLFANTCGPGTMTIKTQYQAAVFPDCNANGLGDTCEPEWTDVALFAAQLIAQSQDPASVCMYDAQPDGKLDGRDIQPFLERVLQP